MAVRFLPVPEDPSSEDVSVSGDHRISGSARAGGDRGDLAEVIELRSKLAQLTEDRAEPPASSASPASAPEPRQATERGARRPAQRARDAAAPGSASQAADERDVRADAVRFLARRALSSGELRAQLLEREHDAHEVQLLIEEFLDAHYLDDNDLARAVAEKLRTSKRLSRAQIRVKLRERRLPDTAIELAVSELGEDEEAELLVRAARDRARRMHGLEHQVALRRLLGFLARRGWSGDAARRAAEQALSDSGVADRIDA